jgi:hypothetical protein
MEKWDFFINSTAGTFEKTAIKFAVFRNFAPNFVLQNMNRM